MIDEKERLHELRGYRIMDSPPEKELDEIAEIASALLDVPMALITLIDEDRQWFKANKGLAFTETPRKDSFCQHALQYPNEVLVVDNPSQDERFKDNPLVLGTPNIRFYAGAPLETPSGKVLGTLCILDNKPRVISDNQKQALMLLAKKAMEYLEVRKALLEQDEKIDSIASRLLKLSDQAPGAIYQLEMSPSGALYFPFISKGISRIHPTLNPMDLQLNANIAFDVVDPEDLDMVRNSLLDSYKTLENWNVEYRVLSEDGTTVWHWAHAKPEKKEDGTVVWYGTFQDITNRKAHIQTLEQILFDISHVMRRPVATMLGLTTAINKGEMDEKTIKTLVGHLSTVAEEMDRFIRNLNDSYDKVHQNVTRPGKN